MMMMIQFYFGFISIVRRV